MFDQEEALNGATGDALALATRASARLTSEQDALLKEMCDMSRM